MRTLTPADHAAADAAYRLLVQQARPGRRPAAELQAPGSYPLTVARTAAGLLVLERQG